MASSESVVRLTDTDIIYVIGGSGPLLVLSYVLGPAAWGSLDQLAKWCTVAAVNPLATRRQVSLSRDYAWFGDFVRELGFSTASLATWSLGAPDALSFAATSPPELTSLVLVDPAGLNPGALRPLPRPQDPTPEQVRAMVASMWRFWVRSKSVDTSELQELHYRLLAQPESYDLNARANATAATEMMFDDFESIQVPVLLLAGRHSRVFGRRAAKRVAGRFPDARTVIFSKSGHALQLEEPERFAEVVREFVRDTV
jgi:pimeloyl-ACP methyl ester carboxylesterase